MFNEEIEVEKENNLKKEEIASGEEIIDDINCNNN